MLAATLVLSCCVFLPAAADPVNPVKLAILVWAAIALLGLAAARAFLDKKITLPAGMPGCAAAGLLLAFACSALVAPVSAVAVVGTYGRNSGLLAYTGALVVFATAMLVLRAHDLIDIATGLLVAGGFTAGYGLLQLSHHDPIHWSNPFNPIIASLGNPDFASAYLGICVPVALWLTLDNRRPRGMRIVAGGVGSVCLAAAVLSDAIQGPLAAAVGSAVVLLPWSLDQTAKLRLLVGSGLAALALSVVTLGVLGLAGYGPGARALSGTTFLARKWYWQSALHMWRRHPFLGVGLDAYGFYFRQVRPLASTRLLGGREFSDAAHNVPLQMAAQGGLVLAGAYIVFVGTIGFALVRGLRNLRGPDRLQLGGIGGAWAASQVQSWVSIDQVPLIAVQYLLAAAVVVASGHGTLRVVSLRRHPDQVAGTRAKRQARQTPRRPPVTHAGRASLALITSVGLVGAWLACLPLRADISALSGDVARDQGLTQNALADYETAVTMMPGISRYWARIAAVKNGLGDTRGALRAYAAATSHDPYDIDAWRNEGRLAEAVGDIPLARSCFARAVHLDPTDDATILDQATFQLRHAEAELALRSLYRAVALLPALPALWASLGDAQAVLGEPGSARVSYRRALTLQPNEPTATRGLTKLDAHQQ
ncbi:MAG: hypothetical protein NVS3B26_17700 [Mycobacteriales bacterium]